MGKASMSLLVATMLGFLVLCGPAWAVEPNLVSHWKFDEGSGTTAYDSAGSNDGTIYGAQWTTGKIDGALSFDGNEDYVEVPSSVSFDSTTATWSLWVKPTGDPGGSGSSPWGTGCIMIRGDSWGTWNGVHISLMPHATYGTIAIQVKANANPSVLVEDTVFSSPDITYNDWSHIAFVFDSGNYAELYVNGALTVNYTLGNFAFNNQVLRIATSTDPYLYDFNGEVGEVVIHDRALSPEEIQELYLEGLSEYERAIICVEDALAEKEAAMDGIDAALEKEWLAYDALEELLESGDYGDLKKGDMVKAKQEIHSAMQHEQQSADALEKSIEKLEDVLAALGWEPEPEPEPNLVSYWKFDEGSGTIAVDSVGGNHGTLFGDTVWTSSPIDGALSFDGDGDYVDCGNGASINNLTRFSISLWFKADVIPSSSGDYFISQRDLSSVVWTFILHGDFSGRVAGAVIADGSNAISTTDFIPNIGEWYHGAMTYDDLGDRKIRIYINGTEQSYLQHWAVSGTMASNPSVHVAIGNRIGGGRDFGGSIDEVMIFNRILSPEEIEQLYQDGLDGSGKSKGK